MRRIWNILFKGLATVIPVALTLYLIFWLGRSIERLLHSVLTLVLPESYYLPGMGLAAGLVLLFLVGLAVNAWVVQRLLRWGERLLERIPFIKSIYGALRDFMNFFSTTQHRRDLQQVVLVTINDTRLIGFLTSDSVTDLPASVPSEETVAVYLPMSYQIGGYTLYLPRSRIEPMDMSIEDAMRRVLTAGLSHSGAARSG